MKMTTSNFSFDFLKMENAREAFLKYGKIESCVRPIIASSWKRCKDHNIDFEKNVLTLQISKAELDMRIASRGAIIDAAVPYMQMLVDACNDEISVHLYDEEAYLLQNCGQIQMPSYEKDHIRKGSLLNEETAGTNATALVLRDKRPVQVVAGEHYCTLFKRSASTASPIFDADGNFCGIITVIVESSEFYPNLMGMVVAVTNAIEQQLKLNQAKANVIKPNPTLKTNAYLNGRAKYVFDDMVGENPLFQKMIQEGQKAASSASNILLLGESGTGKELLAQSIHNAGSRRGNRFVAVNCGAIPREMIESELFGYEDGAFTGARKGGYQGKFEYAAGGTIFLDEIGDMPVELQVNLLRVIQEKQITRVGGHRVVPVDVRIIAATHRNLREYVKLGKFREDLYYRLNVFPIKLPPLRERPDDIPLLAEHLIRVLCARIGKLRMTINEDAVEKLCSWHWPGNIRELENVLERAINITNSHQICSDDLLLEDELFETAISADAAEPSAAPVSPSAPDAILPLSEIERQAIEHALGICRGNIKYTAEALGISRNTLYNKMKQYGITPCSEKTKN